MCTRFSTLVSLYINAWPYDSSQMCDITFLSHSIYKEVCVCKYMYKHGCARTCLTVGADVVAVTLTRVAVDVILAGAAVLTRWWRTFVGDDWKHVVYKCGSECPISQRFQFFAIRWMWSYMYCGRDKIFYLPHQTSILTKLVYNNVSTGFSYF